MNRVAVVVLNYRGIEDTVSCLESLSKQTLSDFTVVAVENGSNDGSTDTFKDLEVTYGSRLKTLYNQKNLGFAGGVNAGIRWAIEHDYEYVALLNNDALPSNDWLETLLHAAKSQQSGITTGLLLHEDGSTIDSTGDWYSDWGLPFPRGRNEPATSAPISEYVFSGSGGASLYSVAMLKAIGLFDETFFAYYEDIDLSFRAQLAGYKVYYESKAVAYHKQGATSGKMPGFTVLQTFKNLPLLYIKNVPRGLLIPIGIRFWAAYFLMLSKAILRGSGLPALKGLFSGIPLFWLHALPERRRIQRTSCVTAEYIYSMLWHDLPPDQTGLRKLRSTLTFKRDRLGT